MFQIKLNVLSLQKLTAAQGAIHYGLTRELKIKRTAPICLTKELPFRKVEDESYYDFTYSIYTHLVGIGIKLLAHY